MFIEMLRYVCNECYFLETPQMLIVVEKKDEFKETSYMISFSTSKQSKNWFKTSKEREKNRKRR